MRWKKTEKLWFRLRLKYERFVAFFASRVIKRHIENNFRKSLFFSAEAWKPTRDTSCCFFSTILFICPRRRPCVEGARCPNAWRQSSRWFCAAGGAVSHELNHSTRRAAPWRRQQPVNHQQSVLQFTSFPSSAVAAARTRRRVRTLSPRLVTHIHSHTCAPFRRHGFTAASGTRGCQSRELWRRRARARHERRYRVVH